MSGWQIDKSATVYPIEHGDFPASYVLVSVSKSQKKTFFPTQILPFLPPKLA